MCAQMCILYESKTVSRCEGSFAADHYAVYGDKLTRSVAAFDCDIPTSDSLEMRETRYCAQMRRIAEPRLVGRYISELSRGEGRFKDSPSPTDPLATLQRRTV